MSDKTVTTARGNVEELQQLLRDLTTLRDVTQASYDEAVRALDRALAEERMPASKMVRTPRPRRET